MVFISLVSVVVTLQKLIFIMWGNFIIIPFIFFLSFNKAKLISPPPPPPPSPPSRRLLLLLLLFILLNYYSHLFFQIIVQYIVDNNYFKCTRGITLWQKIEQSNIVPGPNWKSLKEQFRRVILRNLAKFDLEADVEQQLLVGGSEHLPATPKKG